MISTVPGATETAVLEGAPAGLTVTVQLRDNDETLLTLAAGPVLDADSGALAAYESVSFVVPDNLPFEAVWLAGGNVIGRELWRRRDLSTDTAAETDARERLVLRVVPSMAPVITSIEIDMLLMRARRVDADGLYPSDPDWTPTWTDESLDAAAVDAWELRAARCMGGIDFAEDGQSFKMSQRFEQCIAMAKLYRRGSSGVGSARVPAIVSSPTDVA